MSSFSHPVETPRLASSDYDGTIFYTDVLAPNGMDVNAAYGIGLKEHVGELAAELFFNQDGHNHRAPEEIVRSVAPDLSPDELAKKTRRVVGTKLEVLEDCVGLLLDDGTPWPPTSEGFVEFWQLVDDAKQAGELVGTAILSNGHTSFEQRTFEMLGLSQPDIFLTDDVLQSLALNIPHDKLVKPSPFLIELAKHLYSYQLAQRGQNLQNAPPRVVHIGDALKDEHMAANARVPFVYLHRSQARASWQEMAAVLHLGKLPLREGLVRGEK